MLLALARILQDVIYECKRLNSVSSSRKETAQRSQKCCHFSSGHRCHPLAKRKLWFIESLCLDAVPDAWFHHVFRSFELLKSPSARTVHVSKRKRKTLLGEGGGGFSLVEPTEVIQSGAAGMPTRNYLTRRN